MKTKVHNFKVFFDAIELAHEIKNEMFLSNLDTETLQGILDDAVEFERYEVAQMIKNIIDEKRL